MSFLHIDMSQVVEILPRVRQECNLFYIVNSMGADVLARQGARASATMISNLLNQVNSVPARLGLITCIIYVHESYRTVMLVNYHNDPIQHRRKKDMYMYSAYIRIACLLTCPDVWCHQITILQDIDCQISYFTRVNSMAAMIQLTLIARNSYYQSTNKGQSITSAWGRDSGCLCEFKGWFITRGQFWPPGIVVACVCVSVNLCVNHLFVRAITQDPFKLGSPNFNHRCKRPWLRSLLFLRVNDLDLQG